MIPDIDGWMGYAEIATANHAKRITIAQR